MGFFSRTPFALLGALGLVSLIQDLLQWQEQIGLWIDAWQAVTRPVVQFLFGWIPELLKMPFPWWAQDYLTMSLITLGAGLRMQYYVNKKNNIFDLALEVIVSLFWPAILVTLMFLFAYIAFYRFELNESDKAGIRAWSIFLESFIWAGVLIAVNYVLLFAGAR